MTARNYPDLPDRTGTFTDGSAGLPIRTLPNVSKWTTPVEVDDEEDTEDEGKRQFQEARQEVANRYFERNRSRE